MKNKIIAFIIITLMISCSVIACQSTPKKEVVIGKGEEAIEEILEKTISTPDPSNTHLDDQPLMPANLYATPNSLDYLLKSELVGAKITVDVDAEIIVPQYALPIARVKNKNIEYDQIKALVSLIADGKCLYFKSYADKIMTKEKIQGMIDYYMSEISKCTPEMKKQRTNYENYVKQAYKDMEMAPSTYADAVVEINKENPIVDHDGNVIGYEDGTGMIISEDMLGEVVLSKSNYNKQAYNLVIGEEHQPDRLILKCEETKKQQLIKYQLGNKTANLFSFCDIAIVDDFSINIEEAKKIAESYVNVLDSGLSLSDVGAVVSREYVVGDDIEILDSPFGYNLIFTKMFNGVNANYATEDNAWKYADMGSEDEYNEPYSQESLSIIVGKDGVYSIEYYCPMKVVETIATDTELLPFEDIRKMFDEYIVLNGFDPSQEVYLKINRIELGMMRIAQPNKTNEYLVIPVWDFYGGSIRSHSGKDLTEEQIAGVNEFFGRSFLTINAIDGSIIDRSLGY